MLKGEQTCVAWLVGSGQRGNGCFPSPAPALWLNWSGLLGLSVCTRLRAPIRHLWKQAWTCLQSNEMDCGGVGLTSPEGKVGHSNPTGISNFCIQFLEQNPTISIKNWETKMFAYTVCARKPDYDNSPPKWWEVNTAPFGTKWGLRVGLEMSLLP